MNVSIITMTRTYNYGATLQAYALQTYIESLGHNCNIIDHMGTINHKKIKLDTIKIDTLIRIPYKSKLERGYANFEQFYQEKMHMTERYSSIDGLKANPPKSDVFISGSDQVWNPRDLRGEFYLNFAPTGAKKVSYAASIGVPKIPDDKKENIISYLENMDAISVREDGAVKSIQELTKKKVAKNCDPVYLIEKEEWEKLEKCPLEINDDYILFYMIYKPEWINDWIRKVKKKTGKKIVVVGLNGYRNMKCDYYVRNAGPREFLWLLNHASAVVSSSFHGIAFSVLFGKPFVAMPDPPRPDRILNLLRMFGLENRIIYENTIADIFKKIDYSSIINTIGKEKKKTQKYFNLIFKE